MTDTQLTILVSAIPGILLSLATFINSVRNGRKIDDGTAKVEAGNATVERIEVHTNGMSKKLENAAFIAGAKSETDKTK